MWCVIFHVQGLQKSSDFSDSLIRWSWERKKSPFVGSFVGFIYHLHVTYCTYQVYIYIYMVQCWVAPLPAKVDTILVGDIW